MQTPEVQVSEKPAFGPMPRPGFIEAYGLSGDGAWALLSALAIVDRPSYFPGLDFRLRFCGQLHEVRVDAAPAPHAQPLAPVLSIEFTPSFDPRYVELSRPGDDQECFWIAGNTSVPGGRQAGFVDWYGWLFYDPHNAVVRWPRYQVRLIGQLSQLSVQPLPLNAETGQPSASCSEHARSLNTADAPSETTVHEYVTVRFTAGH